MYKLMRLEALVEVVERWLLNSFSQTLLVPLKLLSLVSEEQVVLFVLTGRGTVAEVMVSTVKQAHSVRTSYALLVVLRGLQEIQQLLLVALEEHLDKVICTKTAVQVATEATAHPHLVHQAQPFFFLLVVEVVGLELV